MKANKLPSWFNGELYEEGKTVENRFSGEKYELNNVELSMYDFVIGSLAMVEMGVINEDIEKGLQKGLDWFRENNAEAYMVLLD